MKHSEAEQLKKRVGRYEALCARRDEIKSSLDTITSVSGNTSEVQRVSRLVIARGGAVPNLQIDDCGITDWEVRQALEPLIRKKYGEVIKAIEEV